MVERTLDQASKVECKCTVIIFFFRKTHALIRDLIYAGESYRWEVELTPSMLIFCSFTYHGATPSISTGLATQWCILY